MPKHAYHNRELSWLQFNDRVLREADNQDNPLLERGKFLSIVESNLDEFYMVRVGGLMHALFAGDFRRDPAGMSTLEQLARIRRGVLRQVKAQYEILNEKYLPALEDEGIFFLKFNQLSKAQRAYLSDYFDAQIAPLLTPCAVTPKRPFPLLAPKRLHLALLLPPKARGEAPRFALLPLPNAVDRVVMLKEGVGKARGVLLEDVVAAFAHRLFNGDKPIVCQPFRLTRNSDIAYDDSHADTLITEMRKNLNKRKWGAVIRLEVPAGMDSRLLSRLKRYLDVTDDELFFIPGPINPNYFMKQIASLEGFDSLRFPPFTPRVQKRLADAKTVFDAIREGDILMHHPYDSFETVVRLMDEAADDPDVLAIKQTLYRVSGKSPIVAALSRAAQNGKQVTVLIEVRARFDEENNINWCLSLEKAGCQVIYGVPNYKAHSKITLIVRREGGMLTRYVHMATGNYNDSTARMYTDYGLLTADPIIGQDAGAFFNAVTGYADKANLQKLIAAPDHMRPAFRALIEREIKNAENGLPAGITAKCNALTDQKMIKLLYRAADAGVPVRLVIRSACCLSVKGHKNITVRSIVGRFLEHARVYIFENAGEKKVFLSSADWMTRNLDKRVELLFPVDDPDLAARVSQELSLELKDNQKAWCLKKDGRYARAERTEPLINAQENNIFYT